MAIRKKEHRETNGPDFSKKKQSVNGIISVIIGVIALVILISAGIFSSHDVSGNAFVSGIMGIVALFFAATGATYGADGLKDRDTGLGFPVTGICMNTVVFIYMIYLYLYGLVVR